MKIRGRVESGVVVLQDGAALTDGTWVEITPLNSLAGSPSTVLETEASSLPVSKERQAALLALIGICKTDHPPSDEEVERIIEEARMKKYG